MLCVIETVLLLHMIGMFFVKLPSTDCCWGVSHANIGALLSLRQIKNSFSRVQGSVSQDLDNAMVPWLSRGRPHPAVWCFRMGESS